MKAMIHCSRLMLSDFFRLRNYLLLGHHTYAPAAASVPLCATALMQETAPKAMPQQDPGSPWVSTALPWAAMGSGSSAHRFCV